MSITLDALLYCIASQQAHRYCREDALCQHTVLLVLVVSSGSLGHMDLGMLFQAAPWTQTSLGSSQHGRPCPCGSNAMPNIVSQQAQSLRSRRQAPPCQHTILVISGVSLGPRDLGMLFKAAPWTKQAMEQGSVDVHNIGRTATATLHCLPAGPQSPQTHTPSATTRYGGDK